MTIAELLAQYGLDEPKTTSFLADMKANKIFTASEENMDIRHGKVKKDLEDMTRNFNDANAMIEQLQKNNKNNEDLQKSVTDYQARLAAAEKQAEQENPPEKIEDLRLNGHVQRCCGFISNQKLRLTCQCNCNHNRFIILNHCA